MKHISLTQGQYALVSNHDYIWLNQHKWYALKDHRGNFYAVRASYMGNNKQHQIKMHRQILELERGDKQEGDHINHNTLDNRRSNLRICTRSQNQMNRKPSQNTSSKYKGVTWDKKAKKWKVHIVIIGKLKHLGYFHNEIFAAGVYDKAAIREFGEFAHLNFPLTIAEIVV